MSSIIKRNARITPCQQRPLFSKKKIFFERPIIRKTKVKQLDSELQQRPTVVMSVVLGAIEEQVEFTLVDRSGYLYQALIGRNFLRDRVVVDVSQAE